MEREGELATFHAFEVQPRKDSHVDMAGGQNVEQHQTTMGKPEGDVYSVGSSNSADGETPTEEDVNTLRKIPDEFPASAFLIAVIELAERFCYYGLSGLFQNYIENPYPGRHPPRSNPNFVPGALDMGETAATGLTSFFQFWCYITPIIGAIVADQYLGRYRTIVVFGGVYLVGLIILFVTSLPVSITNGAGLGGLVTAMIVIGLGTGGIKSNVSPLIAEQYKTTKRKIKTLNSGERVIVDPAITVQRIYMLFYLCINLGSLSAIATTEMERHVSYWSAFLLSMLMMFVSYALVIFGRKQYVTRPPTGSVLPKAMKACWIGIMGGFKMDAAKPAYQAERGGKYNITWDDQFVEELKRALIGAQVFLAYPIYWVVYNQMLNNFISQASYMALHGIPNDLLQNIDPIAIIIFIPIFDRLIYPGFRKIGIAFKPITRIFWGFILASGSMAYAAGCQKLILDNGKGNVHVAIQTPAYFLIGISEILASITGLEYAYTKAPSTMKSFIMSIFLFQTAIGSALNIALAPTAVFDKLLWMFSGLAVACFIAGLIFWACFSRYNKREESLNAMEQKGVQMVQANEAYGNEQGRDDEKA